MTASILIKSFPKDFGFLAHCLKSINKFCTSFEEIVVLIPEGSDLPLTQERVVKVKEPPSNDSMHGSGYTYQQVCKLNADKYVKSDIVVHVDSDVLFTRPVTPDDFLVNGKPLWLKTPMVEVVAGDKNSHAHATAMREFSGEESEWEFMRRAPEVIPRWAYGCFRDYARELHGMSFEEWAMNRGFRGVTEFNHIGFFLHKEFPNLIHFHDTRFGLPELFVRQFWSWGGLTEEVRAEIEQILS